MKEFIFFNINYSNVSITIKATSIAFAKHTLNKIVKESNNYSLTKNINLK